jgi:hypothetical protein
MPKGAKLKKIKRQADMAGKGKNPMKRRKY